MKSKYNERHVYKVIRYYQLGYPMGMIGSAAGVPNSRVRKMLKSYGVIR